MMNMNLCYKGLTGKVITPCNMNYDVARQEWNRAIQKFPVAIVYCFTETDISNAICWARYNHIGIRIRSGGHHYEGYSVGDGILVIDISALKRIDLDEMNNTVTIQCGVTNTQLYHLLGSKGYPFPGGTCPTVGVTGYTLGGGWGYSSRYFGLGCDSLIELEIIDYQGKAIKANEQYHGDLFWACRGAGGGNFGLVTSLTFRLPPKIDHVSLVTIEYINTPPTIMLSFLDTWQKWLVNLDSRITMNASLYNSALDGMGIFGRGLFYGSASEAKAILKPFENIEGAVIDVQEMTFLEAIEKIEESYPDSEKFQSTGRFVNRQYNLEELTHIVDLINQRPEGSVYTAISVYALGGKVRNVYKTDTAFYYRDASYIIGIQSVWEDNRYAGLNQSWLYERFQYLYGLTIGSYVNFPYKCLQDYEQAYYGANVWKLEQVNGRYDPLNVFQFPQAIQSYTCK